MNKLTPREKAIICGLFLSKFDSVGLSTLGFQSFREAYNVLGLAISVSPASIKNYRDELDPLFPNSRQGWHKRKIREHCQVAYDLFHDYDLIELANMISMFAGCGLADETSGFAPDKSNSFGNRLLTGKAAENFFLANYSKEPEFTTSTAIDMTQAGCGYDFKLKTKEGKDYKAVEVKGLQKDKGGIMLTSKEYETAEALRDDYFIYIVKNFEESPYAVKYCDPLNSFLRFKRAERTIVQISWNATI